MTGDPFSELAADLLQAMQSRIDAGIVQWEEAAYICGIALSGIAHIAAAHEADPDIGADFYVQAARQSALSGLRMKMPTQDEITIQ